MRPVHRDAVANDLAGVQGLEPRLMVPETTVLPLDDTPPAACLLDKPSALSTQRCDDPPRRLRLLDHHELIRPVNREHRPLGPAAGEQLLRQRVAH